jgi:hypothetical protein
VVSATTDIRISRSAWLIRTTQAKTASTPPMTSSTSTGQGLTDGRTTAVTSTYTARANRARNAVPRTLHRAAATPGASTNQDTARNRSSVATSTTAATITISAGSSQPVECPRQ